MKPFTTPRLTSLRWSYLAGLIGLCLTGCSINDYEGKMAAEQTRLDYYDLENKHLDAPVDMPKKKDAKGIDQPVFDESVYFRPPPGIQRTPDANPVPGTNLSYRYPSKNSTCLFQEVRLAVAGLDAKDFEKDIVQPFPGLDWSAKKPTSKQVPGRMQVNFQTHFYTGEGSDFHIFLATVQDQSRGELGRKLRVVVIFRVLPGRSTNKALTDQMDYSLRSLAIGKDASDARTLFSRRTAAAQQPK